jgi:hypothetical protein
LLIYDQRLNSLKPLTEGTHLSILKSLLRALEEAGPDASSIERLHAAAQQALQNPVQSYASEHRTVMDVTPEYRTIGSDLDHATIKTSRSRLEHSTLPQSLLSIPSELP